MVITSFVCSYVITVWDLLSTAIPSLAVTLATCGSQKPGYCRSLNTVLHLLIFGGLIIGKVYCVSRRNDTLYGYSRANHYQRNHLQKS